MSSMNQPPTLLKVVIVEDNVSLNDIYKTRLELLGYKCFSAYDGLEALAVIETQRPNLVLLDLMVPKMAGDQILATMRAHDWGKAIKVLVISNLNEADAPAGLREQGIEGYAIKANLTNDDIDKLVDNILKPAGQDEAVDLEASQPAMSELAESQPLVTNEPVATNQESPGLDAPERILPAHTHNGVMPFLMFPTNGKAAVDLYMSVFKDAILYDSMVSPDGKQLLYASFNLNGQQFMAMDGGITFGFSDGISLFVSCADQAEIDYYWHALTANGGTPGRCGWLTDTFGVSWQIIPEALEQLMQNGDSAAAGRVHQAMMHMDKIDVAELEAAAKS